MTSRLLVKPGQPDAGGRIHHITPEHAGWKYVGFELFRLQPGEQIQPDSHGRELCIVLVGGRARVDVGTQAFGVLGERHTPFEGKPFAVYVPPGEQASIRAESELEVAIGSAPATGRFAARVIRPADIDEEVRGTGTNTRYVRNILPETREAERLLIAEVLTPGGHWSSYPPHKHDSAAGGETQLEETYYHRLARAGGFAFQRVYTDDRSLDETVAAEDGDVVLVPRGYHPVSAPHGNDLYYLNVMAGPERRWRFTNEPGYEFLTRVGR
jgi:5-deoxy-glucuronate isomerase